MILAARNEIWRLESDFGGSKMILAARNGFLRLESDFGRLKRNLSVENGFERHFSSRFTFSHIWDFVSRRDATFSIPAKIGGVLELHFTFSQIWEFVKWAKKSAHRRENLTVKNIYAILTAPHDTGS